MSKISMNIRLDCGENVELGLGQRQQLCALSLVSSKYEIKKMVLWVYIV